MKRIIIAGIVALGIIIMVISFMGKDSCADKDTAKEIIVVSQPEEEDQQRENLKDSVPITSLQFERQTINFGDVKQDTILTAIYIGKNTGTEPLVIYYVNPDCRCASYSLSKSIINPSDTLSINIKFDTANKIYEQRLNITVRANTHEEMYKLSLKANIID